MQSGKACIQCIQALLFAAASFAFATAQAEEQSSNWLSFEAGAGYEQQTAPLFQVSPDSTIIYIDGLRRLAGSSYRTSIQGFAEKSLGNGVGFMISGDASVKRSPATPDLNFSSISAQPGLHFPVGASSAGLGLNFQRMEVAGQHFRDVQSVQGNWTVFDQKNFWAVIGDVGVNNHRGQLADLDARTASLVVKRQVAEPLKGLDSADLTAVVGRESNVRGLAELSHSSAMLHGSVHWKLFGASWTAGQAWRIARFDESAFANEAARRDGTAITDLAATWELSKKQSLRIEFNNVRNHSNTRLYENHFQQITLSLRTWL
jgi:hypothetical protein